MAICSFDENSWNVYYLSKQSICQKAIIFAFLFYRKQKCLDNGKDKPRSIQKNGMETVNHVLHGASIKQTARDYDVNYKSLGPYVQLKRKGNMDTGGFGYKNRQC